VTIYQSPDICHIFHLDPLWHELLKPVYNGLLACTSLKLLLVDGLLFVGLLKKKPSLLLPWLIYTMTLFITSICAAALINAFGSIGYGKIFSEATEGTEIGLICRIGSVILPLAMLSCWIVVQSEWIDITNIETETSPTHAKSGGGCCTTRLTRAFCGTVRTGALVVSVFYFMATVFAMIWAWVWNAAALNVVGLFDLLGMFAGVVVLLQLVIDGLLLFGVHKKKSVWILPGLISRMFLIILQIIGLTVLQTYTVNILSVFVQLVFILLSIYMWKITQSEYLNIKDNEKPPCEEVARPVFSGHNPKSSHLDWQGPVRRLSQDSSSINKSYSPSTLPITYVPFNSDIDQLINHI